MRGLNVGSGQRRFDVSQGWTNLDRVCRPSVDVGGTAVFSMPDVSGDGGQLPMRDNTFRYVISHHCLEHFGCGEGRGMIREAHRVLTAGGSFIVTVPDMRKLAVLYLTGQIDTQLYMTNVYGAYMGSPEDRHKWGFDPKSLMGELRAACEWAEVKLFDWRAIPGADIARDDRWILGVEAVR